DYMLALTVSGALFFTVILAKTVGSMLPIIARKLKIDPAIMAAPIITTIVDALSLVIYLNLARHIYISALVK
ncbi:MAG TPA: magnesium transporter, partial [Candidatus Cloacimonadota bacterium]|nr:magnesium transporter [Candidatus Cloacimonadota bacterium]